MVVTVAFLVMPARNRLAGSAITVFSSNTFALILSHCIKVVSTELFLKGASQHSYQALKTLPFPMAVCSAVLLECIDQTTQRSNPSFPLLAKRPNPLSQKGFLPGWGRLIPLWNWELLSASWSQQAGEGVKLVLSRAAQSGSQAHFFHHLFIHRPCHCCHQSTPENSGHTASEKAKQPKVLQREINSNSSQSA